MTPQTHEQEIRLGHFVLGFFDILGQSGKLRQLGFPPRNVDEEERVIRQAVADVNRLRGLFQRHFDERRTEVEQAVSESPESHREAWRELLAPRIVSWGISDAYCVAVPLRERGSGTAGAFATMVDLLRALEAAAITWLFSLAAGAPLRGGMEIGTAASIGENEVYGGPLARAHHLESEVAGWPRIVVGEHLVEFLKDHRQDDLDLGPAVTSFADQCWSMLRQDRDDRMTIDALGGSWATPERRRRNSDMFARAYATVHSQLREHEAARCSKLVRRYTELRTYFTSHAPNWHHSASARTP